MRRKCDVRFSLYERRTKREASWRCKWRWCVTGPDYRLLKPDCGGFEKLLEKEVTQVDGDDLVVLGFKSCRENRFCLA